MDKKEIGTLIATLRKEKNMTQKDLANILGVTNRAVSKWETGDGYPDITHFPMIAETFEITTEELLTGKLNRKGNSEKRRTNLEEYFFQNSIGRFRNQYLISLFIVLMGVFITIYVLSQYRGIYTTIVYAEVIAISSLLIGSRYYYNTYKSLNEIQQKYKTENDHSDEKKVRSTYFDHLMYCAFSLVSFIMIVLVIPLYQYLCRGYYRVNRTIIGQFDIPEGKLAIDYSFLVGFACISYLAFFALAALLLKRRMYKDKLTS